MLIRWNRKGLNMVPVPAGKGKKKFGYKSNIMLIPGINEIDDNFWPAIEPLLKHHIEKKNIEIISGNKEGEVAKNLLDISSEKAEEIIEDTNNIDLLKHWLDAEIGDNKRPEVRIALVKRIEVVENKIAPAGKEKD